MIAAIIVWGSVFCAAVYCLVYLLSPRLRAQIEQPKYRFQEQVQNFDKARQEDAAGQEKSS